MTREVGVAYRRLREGASPEPLGLSRPGGILGIEAVEAQMLMQHRIYKGTEEPHDSIRLLPEPRPGWRDADRQRRAYVPASELEVERVNKAMLLRRPLLVTGWPGSGSSSIAYRIAHELRLEAVLRWHVTKASTVKDGLYLFDRVGFEQDANIAQVRDVPDSPRGIENYLKLGPLGTAFTASRNPRVLLIQDIDRASDQLIDDLLVVLDEGCFSIPELARSHSAISRIALSDHVSGTDSNIEIAHGNVYCRTFPFIVVTSQGRRDLPYDLLRNCIQLHIPYPDRKSRKRIISSNFREGVLPRSRLDELATRAAEGTQLTVDQVLDVAHMAIIDDAFDIQESLQAYYQEEPSPDTEARATSVKERLTTAPPGYDIFLSYAASDAEVAGELRATFVRSGMTCFMAEKDIIVASLWETSIRDALISSTSILLLLTPRSIDRPWILLEGGAAWALGKPIIPALVHVTPDALIDPIRKFQARVVETTAHKQALARELKEALTVT